MRVLLIFSLFVSTVAFSKSSSKVIISVEETQEERKELRWTLTEWLRIKERMKMMDVWLAMNSNPAKDTFKPEIQLAYWQARGEYQLDTGVDGTMEKYMTANDSSNEGRIQLYLTNLVTAATGWKVPNIDLGLEALYIAHKFTNKTFNPPNTTPLTSVESPFTMTGYLNFRLLGNNVQDTSLTAKVGYYAGKRGFDTTTPLTLEPEGFTYAGEFVFYLFSFFGLDASFNRWGTTTSLDGNQEQRGTRYDYGAFIEIYLLRIGGGYFKEMWEFSEIDEVTGQRGQLKSVVSGMQFSAKLSF